MSLYYPDPQTPIDLANPGLHALVIGVADYPHLVGGKGPLAKNPLGLNKITTPLHTAKRFLEWLDLKYCNPARPLKSIEALVSPSPQWVNSQGYAATLESATADHIEQAFNRWLARCSAHPDNIALLYFCGHGLMKTDQYLLAEDFGDPAWASDWRNCIDFDSTRLGMASCKAQTQIFFIDACRETPYGMLNSVNVSGRNLANATYAQKVRCSATYYSTTPGNRAFGPAAGPTYFCETLIDCLDGYSGVKNMGQIVVDTHSLGNALGKVMAQNAIRYREPLSCHPSVAGLEIIHHPKQSSVLAALRCSSDIADNAANIELRQGASSFVSPMGQSKPLFQAVPPGNWDVVLTFPTGAFPAQPTFTDYFDPPVYVGVNLP